MPVITDIKRQKRVGSRYSIYLDGEYSFALSDLELSTSGLRVGQELEAAEVEEYRDGAEQAKVYSLAVRFLGIRPRSRREMSDYLRRKDCSPADIEAVVERLESAHLLGDRQFAESWVAGRQMLRPRSRRMLEQELLAKGVSRDDIAAVLSGLDAEGEIDLLVQVAQKKRRLPQYRDPRKLTEYLMRQGYSYELIKKALARLGDETDLER